MTDKSCCFIQDKNIDINNKTAERKATWGFLIFRKSCVRLTCTCDRMTCILIPANSHAFGLKTSIWRWLTLVGQFLTPDWKMWVVAVLLDTISKNMLTQTHVTGERKPCVKWINDNTFLAISDFWSETHWERAPVYRRPKTGTGITSPSADFGRLWKTSDFFGRLRDSSGIFGNDRVVFKNPSTPRIIKNLTLISQKKLAGIYSVPAKFHVSP